MIAYVLVLIGGAVLFLLPFLWMVSTSLKEPGQTHVFPPQLIPHPPRWRNYLEAWTALPFNLYLRNTLIITGLSIVGQTITASLVAFGFARLRFWGRNVLFICVLATMMVPAQVTMVPMFLVFKALGWVDTFLPLIVPGFCGGSALFIFLLRQYIMTIPHELDDAAKIDGCGWFGIYSRIIMPQIKPALSCVAIFSFMSHWNDFMGPLIYLNSETKKTLSLGLRILQQSMVYTEMHYLMAASILTLLPCLAIFFFAQRYFISGVALTGIKE
jgi:ABC-type glycerol-3-phosphate transport system permease component